MLARSQVPRPGNAFWICNICLEFRVLVNKEL